MFTYVVALLVHCAVNGEPVETVRRLRELPVRQYRAGDPVPSRSFYDLVTQDLRNGLELASTDGRLEILHPDIMADEDLVAWLRRALDRDGRAEKSSGGHALPAVVPLNPVGAHEVRRDECP